MMECLSFVSFSQEPHTHAERERERERERELIIMHMDGHRIHRYILIFSLALSNQSVTPH